MLYELIIKTPPGQAEKCIESNKKVFLGFGLKDKVYDQKVLAHNEYAWYLSLNNPSDYDKLLKRCATGEVSIKKFYNELFRTIHRTNKLASKLSKPLKWVRERVIRLFTKKVQESDSFEDTLRGMNNEEFLRIDDEEEMKTFLTQPLISIKQIQE